MLHDCGVVGMLNKCRNSGLFNPQIELGLCLEISEGFGRTKGRSS